MPSPEQHLLSEALRPTSLAPARARDAEWTGKEEAAAVPFDDQPLAWLRGQATVLGAQTRLAELARRSGQVGQADNLQHFLNTPDARKKEPHLLLFGRDASEPAGAVLLFEYKALSYRSRVFASADSTGRRNVLGPAHTRAALAASGALALLRGGAQVLHLAFSSESVADADNRDESPGAEQQIIHKALRGDRRDAPGWRWATRVKSFESYLPLAATFDATLARIGQRTRSNLRYYRRRAEADLGCVFVAEVQLTLAEFLAFNAASSFTISQALARWRFESLGTLTGPFLRGIRDRDGRWLSLVAGRRGHGFAEIDWQMNRADLPQSSLATVMRAYLIEYEVAQGSTRLYIEGGTPQPIGRSFCEESVCEITVKRESLSSRAVARLAPRLFPEKNYLAQQLADPALSWQASHLT